MPYIPNQARHGVKNSTAADDTVGELNFRFTNAIIEYMTCHNNYQGINDVLGALEGAKLEFYRRWAIPYEDAKIQENGDVYPTGG